MKMKLPKLKKLRRHPKIAAATLTGVIILAVMGIVFPKHSAELISANPSAAGNIIDQCAGSKTTTFSCYKKELGTITAKQGPEAAFSLVKRQYQTVSYVKSQCHQLTHIIGRSAYAKYNDLGNTFTHGDQFCWSGYYHGVMEELSRQKGKETIKTANQICASLKAKSPQSFYHYNCVHGLGHGFMFILNQNLFESLTACDSLTDSWERTSCYGGIFMQNIMNVQSPDSESDHTSKYLKSDQPMYPCTALEEKYKDQCYLMQTSYALQTVSYDFSKVFIVCANIEPVYRNTCFTSLGRDASGSSISDPAVTKQRCLLGPSLEAQHYCIKGAAMDFVSYFHSDQQAHQLCNSLTAELLTDCMATVKNYYQSF